MKNESRKKRANLKGFTQVPNAILYDETLSIGAKGLIAELLANPPDWKTYQKELFGRSSDSFTPQKRALKLLIAKNYISQEQKHRPDGKFEYVYPLNHELIKSLSGEPVSKVKPEGEKPGAVSPSMDKPPTVDPLTVNPDVEKAPNSNTDSLSNTETTNTDSNNINRELISSISKGDTPIIEEQETNQGSKPPTLEEVIVFFKQKGYDSAGAFAFFKEFNQRNWYSIKGEPITNWKGMATHFVKTKGSTFFVIPDDEKEKIGNQLATKIYDLIRASASKIAHETSNLPLLNFSKSDVKKCLMLLAMEKGIGTAKELLEYMQSIKVKTTTFQGFKRSLGLSNPNDSGTKYGQSEK